MTNSSIIFDSEEVQTQLSGTQMKIRKNEINKNSLHTSEETKKFPHQKYHGSFEESTKFRNLTVKIDLEGNRQYAYLYNPVIPTFK